MIYRISKRNEIRDRWMILMVFDLKKKKKMEINRIKNFKEVIIVRNIDNIIEIRSC